MSWVKRNLYFFVSCVLAVALLLAAGWYCYAQWQGSDENSGKLTQAYGQLNEFVNKPITPSSENIDAAKSEAKRAQELADGLQKRLVQIPSIPRTNVVDNRNFAFAVRDTIRQLATAAEANHVLLPADFAFSFTGQRDKAVYAAQSLDQLARELGEVRAICGVLLSNRIDSLEVLQRERTADDAAGTTAQDYLDSLSVTNNNTIISPYQVTFLCFDPALSGVLTGFANQPYGIIIRSMEVAPADMSAADTGMPQAPGMMPGGIPAPPQPGGVPPVAGLGMRGGLPVVIDEKKLRVTMLLELVRIVPPAGK
jgi:hypothetical protein